MSDPLRRLADSHGIAGEYADIWGARHRTSDAVRRGLLGAMRIAADSNEAVERALATLERERWQRSMAPLTVLRSGDRGAVTLRLPATRSRTRFELSIATEDGSELRSAPSRIAQVGSGDLDGEPQVELRLEFERVLPLGYHRVDVLQDDTRVAAGTLAVAPARCYRPSSMHEGRRTWGLALQLYGVRSGRNWGIGDFSDVASLAGAAGPLGIGVIGVNPLHALFPANPEHISPYSPSSRIFLNVLHIDVTAVVDFCESRETRAFVASSAFQQQLERLRSSDRVDYAGVAQAKLTVLRMLYRHFRAQHAPESDRARAFAAFVAEGGEPLRRQAQFDALHAALRAADASMWGWPVWPGEYRDPGSPAVAQFADRHRDDVEFHAYLQWQARLQRVAAAERMRAARLSVGLFVDLSVSVDRGGAETWANQPLYALDASIGAPPDAFNPRGQDWGLPPVIPARLVQAGYAPFIETLRANMKDAGAIRIDHVMGLMRLFWVPRGCAADEGAYVSYPFDDLLGLLALESHRHRCVVIGEDLGTVPHEVRAALAANDVLSYRVLLFEREAQGAFKPPAAYSEPSLVTASTHDLPTLAGWWEGRDLAARRRGGLIASDAEEARLRAERIAERTRLAAALRSAGVTASGTPADLLTPERALEIQRFLAATPAALMMVQPEDIFGAREQANLPGTVEQHPNWQRRLEPPLETWVADPRFAEVAAALRDARGDLRHADAQVPRATYRLQLHGGFTFAQATALIPYLHALGVSHVYCSPYLRARPGSLHGYDIVDHGALNPEIGTRDDFERFVAVLRQHRMGHIADMVPNHMGVMGADNAWWMDVLENGPASRYARFFDIDWNPVDPELAGRVLLPVLGVPYGEALERGDLQLRFEPEPGAFAVWYHGHRFPLDPRTYPLILADIVDAVPAAARFTRLIDSLRAIPPRDAARERIAERQAACERRKRELAALAADDVQIVAAIEAVLARINNGALQAADRGGRLHAILEAQAYRVASWRVAFDEINYRRFFDVNELAALRMEDDAAFEATHRFVLDLAASALIDGLRIDHPDGLHDPSAYLARLQARFAELAGLADAGEGRPLYLVVEKIIAPHEHLPEIWRAQGTTGYRFAAAANGILVDGGSRARIDRTWRAFVGNEAADFESVAYHAKRAAVRGQLAAGLTVLASRALRLARSDRHSRDHTLASLRQGLEEIAACFPVYRTYVSDAGSSSQDRRYIEWAVARARQRARWTDRSVFDFLRGLLLGQRGDGLADDRSLAFAMQFQQFTAPVAAKGIEDTAFYRFNRLVSLADVGGDPDQFGMTVRAFHGASADRVARWPATMLAGSTHDNKRSEDARARIDVLSEVPAVWRLALRRWARFNRSRKRVVEGVPAPSRNDEYLLYQTLIGTWPEAGADDAYRERVRGYMHKAVREAKVHTSWIAVNEEYEQAVASFVDGVLSNDNGLFLDDLREYQRLTAWYGLLNSVTLAIVRFTSPGVPDIYQGDELLDLSLVDPDNRRPVDYALRRRVLAELETLARDRKRIVDVIPALFAAADGRAKLWTLRCLLQSRRRHPDLFAKGDYRAVRVTGQRSDNVLAYLRRTGGEALLIAAGRLFTHLGRAVGELPVGAAWGDTTLRGEIAADGCAMTNLLTGETHVAGGPLRVAEIFRSFPGAVLLFSAR